MLFCVQVIIRKAISVLSALTFNTCLLQFPLITFTCCGKDFLKGWGEVGWCKSISHAVFTYTSLQE